MPHLEIIREPEDDGTIALHELKRGQFAEIVQWEEWTRHVGEVVVRRPVSIVGITFDNAYSAIPKDDNIRVRVLPNGTKFVVRNNE